MKFVSGDFRITLYEYLQDDISSACGLIDNLPVF
jgi:hypothetical protein